MDFKRKEQQDEAVEVSLDRQGTSDMNDNVPVLYDLEGNDALSQSGDAIKIQVQRFSTAALPALLQRALKIALTSKNDRFALDAMRFIQQLSSGKFSEKAIEGVAKAMSDAEILEELSGKK